MSTTEIPTTKRLEPNRKQVEKIRKQLDSLNGLSTNKKIDYVFDGINTYEDGYNISTITLAFDPDNIEVIDGIEYPTTDSKFHMKQKLGYFRQSTQCRKLVLYPNKDKNRNGEWKYFNMQNLEDWDIINDLDKSVVKSINRWIKTITTILKENPEYRNQEHEKEVSEIRYELMLRKRILKRLEKKKAAVVVAATKITVSEEGEKQDNETDEK